ncbi:NERD domain-containing protein [Heyndrickxia camelliae]|uniref:NERD nuclease n=1 Tax=Heyndrickxia camelliae TaxID=1707093 RepID=A0A2N3LH84_9BACI|nr:NERD domain-containing protein [Heyndrickxia camelliae]PKR83966.1 NERD nuclease [Heyndrickxia camelliae]
MITKERGVPIKLRKLEILLRRLHPLHSKMAIINEEYHKIRAGYLGEKSLDYFLSFLPEKQYYIFHYLRLPYQNHHFQIDTLILSPNFITILEVKNISGIITFDYNFNQLIRTKNGVEQAFQDPVSQVNRHQFQLKNFLQSSKFPNIPIIPQVVISNTSTLIKTEGQPRRPSTIITQSAGLLIQIENLSKMYKKEILNKNQLTKLIKFLLKKHTPDEYDVLNQLNINKNEILRGTHCPNCCKIPMYRNHGKWVCPSCHCASKTAHIESLIDFSLLFNKKVIANKEVRDFLEISSQTVATKILKALDLPSTGNGRSKMYHLHKIIDPLINN